MGPGVRGRYSAARPGKGESPLLPRLGPFPKWNLCREAGHRWPRCLSLICSAGGLVLMLSRSDPSPVSLQEQSQSWFPVNPPTPIGSQRGRPEERWPGPSRMVSRDELMSEWQTCWGRLRKPVPGSFLEACVPNPVKIRRRFLSQKARQFCAHPKIHPREEPFRNPNNQQHFWKQVCRMLCVG